MTLMFYSGWSCKKKLDASHSWYCIDIIGRDSVLVLKPYIDQKSGMENHKA